MSPTSQVLAERENSLPHNVLPRMTWEEFLAWADEDVRAEWVDGEVQLMSPVSIEHQEINVWLCGILSYWAYEHDSGLILSAPIAMRIPERDRAREPDILFVARENEHRIRPTFIEGPADMVVEIISPESRDRDRGDKFFEYETAGVREYWLLDPQRRRAEWYQLQSDGAYSMIAPDGDGVYHSQVLVGVWLRESWLWERPHPAVVLREWDLI